MHQSGSGMVAQKKQRLRASPELAIERASPPWSKIAKYLQEDFFCIWRFGAFFARSARFGKNGDFLAAQPPKRSFDRPA